MIDPDHREAMVEMGKAARRVEDDARKRKIGEMMKGPRLFHLYRDTDQSGVSGTGRVAEGTLYPNGKCTLSWNTPYTSVAVYDSLEHLRQIHLHGGKTRVVFDDNCLGCGHPLSDHWSDGCGGCMFAGVEPAEFKSENVAKPCHCALMNHPEFLPTEAK